MADVLIQLANSVVEEVREIRRWMHQHPYVRWEEGPALMYLLGRFQSINPGRGVRYDIQHNHEGGGAWIDVTFDALGSTAPRRLFRADIDALPIEEKTGLEFASTREGFSHACGHDFHAAMLWGAFKLLVEGRTGLVPKCNLRFVLQRAEENPGQPPRPESGGKVLVDEGVCKGVTSAHFLHIWATGERGTFLSRPGAFLGNSDRFQAKIATSGGHVAMPYSGTNALRIAAQVMIYLDTFLSRHLPVGETGTLEPTMCMVEPEELDGNPRRIVTNVMPDLARLYYGFRTFLKPNDRDLLWENMKGRIMKIVQAHDSKAEVIFQWMPGHPALINNEDDFTRVNGILKLNGHSTALHPKLAGGEDFAWYLQNVPGSAWLLGAYQDGTGDHHQPNFNPSEGVLPLGVKFWLLLATQM